MSGTLIMVFSFVRVPLFHLFIQALEHKNYLTATFFSFTIANPYPLLPYLAYGLFGIMIGMMTYFERHKLLKVVFIPVGFFFLLFGLSGMMKFEKSISAPDYFWYFKTNFELGIFLLILTFTIIGLKPESKISHSLSVVKWFSRVSLTIYLLETFTSEILRIICFSILPSWNETINGCLLFGGLNIILWIIFLFFWSKLNFKFSLEYFWVRFFNKIGKRSTKMESFP